MYMKPLESDWKVYRKSVHLWRDRYLETKNEEIAAVLLDGTRSSTERFWEAKEKLERQARVLVECLDDHSRSKMLLHLVLMLRHQMIEEADLEDFSQELRDAVRLVTCA